MVLSQSVTLFKEIRHLLLFSEEAADVLCSPSMKQRLMGASRCCGCTPVQDQQITEAGTMNIFLHWINEDGRQLHYPNHTCFAVGKRIREVRGLTSIYTIYPHGKGIYRNSIDKNHRGPNAWINIYISHHNSCGASVHSGSLRCQRATWPRASCALLWGSCGSKRYLAQVLPAWSVQSDTLFTRPR